MAGYAYILRCVDGNRYYGSTNNLFRRLDQHRRGLVRSTKWRLPVGLVWFEEFETLEQARQREWSLKSGRTRGKAVDLMIERFPADRLTPFA